MTNSAESICAIAEKENLKSINPCVIPLTLYDNSHSKILFRCTICGKEWESYPYKELLRVGLGCAKCSYKSSGANRRKTNSEFVEELNKINPNIAPLGQYETNKKIIKCLCTFTFHFINRVNA